MGVVLKGVQLGRRERLLVGLDLEMGGIVGFAGW